mmetsp:Transcript_68761/g.161672  ORF Transcript_68761/g.161672 Transcript_68761/m.161672 type:complete len:222 (-) Transcript_68761:14-679(-)
MTNQLRPQLVLAVVAWACPAILPRPHRRSPTLPRSIPLTPPAPHPRPPAKTSLPNPAPHRSHRQSPLPGWVPPRGLCRIRVRRARTKHSRAQNEKAQAAYDPLPFPNALYSPTSVDVPRRARHRRARSSDITRARHSTCSSTCPKSCGSRQDPATCMAAQMAVDSQRLRSPWCCPGARRRRRRKRRRRTNSAVGLISAGRSTARMPKTTDTPNMEIGNEMN